MGKIKILIGILIIALNYQFSFSQNGLQGFELSGINLETIEINQTFTRTSEIFPFDENMSTIFGLALKADIVLENGKSLVKVILIDNSFNEYLIYEVHSLLESNSSFSVNNICEETSILNSVTPQSVRVEITNATITINSFTYASGLTSGTDVQKVKKEKKQAQNIEKINKINNNLKAKGLKWVAGSTSVSEMTYGERKKLYGQSNFPPGFEYYVGGVIQIGTDMNLKSVTASLMVDNWDWRNRHGQNWITPVTDQGQCGSCWAFAATGATEAMVNVYFNQHLDLDLSEQDVLSCSGAGDCGGGYPSIALNYITNTGVVDEETFPYSASDQPCENKGSNPSELIKIGGRIDFGSVAYPKTEDVLKRMIIEKGPVSGGLYDWSHAMVLPGYQVVKEGDQFYYRDLGLNRYWITIDAGDPLIGKTVWIFKNSWGANWGDNGYVYVETNISNFGWTHSLLTPVTSETQNYEVICADNDGDGYFWWGLGEKPATCTGPDEPDGDDSNPNLGPLDEYGNCTILGVPPVANFTANNTTINEGESVTFTDLSTNNPTSWLWNFEGGSPATSVLKNPTINYGSQGFYNVTLIASNIGGGSDTITKVDYITVNGYNPSYCESHGNASAEWVESVQIGTKAKISGSSGSTGYDDFTSSTIFNFESGQTYDIVLEPGFNPRNKFEYWSVWIDFNNNKDFTDPGELVLTASKKRSTVYGIISIPDGISTDTRMRISMSRNGIPSPCDIFDAGEVEDYSVSIRVPIPQPPVADFIADKTTVLIGESVSFTDLSTNQPHSWYWEFEGGTPNNTVLQNPIITYNTVGEYYVTLSATNDTGSDTIMKDKYIAVVDVLPPPVYCTSSGISTAFEWIQSVNVDGSTNNSGNNSGYWDFTDITFNLSPGSNPTIVLTPGFSGKSQREFWRVWIDFNRDGDFIDLGEEVITANNTKSSVSRTINIPSGLSGTTLMRVSMKQGSTQLSCGEFDRGEVEDYTVNFSAGDNKNAFIQSSITDNPIQETSFDAYPNPTSNKLFVQLKGWEGKKEIRLFDMTGRTIYLKTITNKIIDIDVSTFPKGIYLLNVNNGILRGNKKISIE